MKPARLASILFSSLAVLAVLGQTPDCRAQDGASGRFAKPEEVVGYWTLVPWTEALKATNLVEPWRLPFQSFAFLPGGGFVSHMASEDPHDTPRALDAIHAMLPKTVRYRFEQGFLVVTRDDAPDDREFWGVNLITREFERDGVRFLPGDLLMSLDDGRGNVVYRRHLRRMQGG